MSNEDKWQRLVAADREYHEALNAVRDAAAPNSSVRGELIAILRKVLTTAAYIDWRLAMEVMHRLDEEFRRAVFSEIVYVAMTTERDMPTPLNLIRAMDREWVREHLPAAVQHVLDQPWADYGQYGAAAYILKEWQSPYLARVIEQADASDIYEVREIADDYREDAAALQRNGGDGEEER